MSQIYRDILLQRSDMTEWLIHFTRRRLEMDEIDTLKSILAAGVLRAGFASRGGRNTIYGHEPAVCFTEQPLYAFKQYLQARNDLSAMAPYGILHHKSDAYSAGANPVIYGLELTRQADEPSEYYVEGCRTIEPRYLPLDEQYRYVAFNPNGNPHPIDWSHEREWRWRLRNHHPFNEIGGFPIGRVDMASDRGIPQGRTHVLVETNHDATHIRTYIDSLAASDSNRYLSRWYTYLRTTAKIISLEMMTAQLQTGRSEYGRLEGWLT